MSRAGVGDAKAAVLTARPSASSSSRGSASVAVAVPSSPRSTTLAMISSCGLSDAASGRRESQQPVESVERLGHEQDRAVGRRGDRGGRPADRIEGGIVPQDRLLEPPQLLARLEPSSSES